MVFSGNCRNRTKKIVIINSTFEAADKFKYLGIIFSSDKNSERDLCQIKTGEFIVLVNSKSFIIEFDF